MHKKVREALRILADVGMPSAQQSERSALCLLAICDLEPRGAWKDASAPLIGITPIMEFIAKHYRKAPYAPNTRETIRRHSMHQFCDGGIALYNPDDPKRAVNSPRAVYQISPEALALVRTFGSAQWNSAIELFRAQRPSLADRYAKVRQLQHVPLKLPNGETVRLSPGEHSQLIRQIVEVFGPHHAPGGRLLYAGDTGDKWGFYEATAFKALGIDVNSHGKMPDVVIHFTEKNWLLLCEAVTSHGPVDGKRQQELKNLFAGSTAPLVYITAFPDRATMSRYLTDIAWETEVWCAEAPTHLIHFNGARFLGPY